MRAGCSSMPVRKKQRGLAYVGLLFVLLFCFTLGLIFLADVGEEYGAVRHGVDRDQAQYLAEAAARHAIWLLEHDCNFAPDSSVYYIKDMGTGRYGYRVNYTASQGVALVGTFGLVNEQQVEQSYVVPVPQATNGYILTAYGLLNTDPRGNKYTYTRCSGSWGTEASLPSGGDDEVTFVAMAASAIADRVAVATMDVNTDNRLAIWNGTSWGSLKTVGKGPANFRAFDVAFEQSSGTALALMRDDNGANARTIRYVTNTSLLGWSLLPANAFSETTDEFRYVRMSPKPASNEILIGSSTKDKQIFLHRWNGVSFTKLAQLENTAPLDYGQPVSVAHEQSSGDGLVVWGDSTATTPRYRTYTGTTLSAEGNLPDFGGVVSFVRMAPHPASDKIALIALDTSGRISLCCWTGTAWGPVRLLENSAHQSSTYGNINFHIAWESNSGDLLAVWTPSGSNTVSYLSVPAGGAVTAGTVGTGPNFLDRAHSLELRRLAGSDNILLMVNTAGRVLRWTTWNGMQFGGTTPAVLKNGTSVNYGMPFAAALVNS